eukprot:290586_1
MTVTITSSDSNNNNNNNNKIINTLNNSTNDDNEYNNGNNIYNRPFYGGIISNYKYAPQQQQMFSQKQTEHTPLKSNQLIDIDNISFEIYNGLQGNSFWFVLFGNNIYIFLLINSIIICNCCIIYIQLIIPYIIIQLNNNNKNNIILKEWQFGLIYIPIQ